MQLLRAVRDQSSGNRQLRVRPRVRTGDETRVCPRRSYLHVYVRAEETGVPDEEQHRGRLRRHVWLQRTLLREGQPTESVSRAWERTAREGAMFVQYILAISASASPRRLSQRDSESEIAVSTQQINAL